jgi:uncharacterized repeat protein (TIGR03943 family)
MPSRHVVRTAALVTWAAFFDWLWLSGASARFVGPRTAWVVVFGAVTLTAAAALHLATGLRAPGARRTVEARELGGLVALVAPVLALAAVPSANLGALAVARKGDQSAYRRPAARAAHAPIDLFDVAYASRDSTFAAERGIASGRRVVLTGLASGAKGGDFDLARFVTTCCAADAVPYRVSIVHAKHVKNDRWYRVTGRLERPGERGFRVRATSLAPIPTPADPYN